MLVSRKKQQFKKFIYRKINHFEMMGDNRNKIYIIPTRLGLFYITITFASFMIGLVYTNNMTLLVTFLLVSFLVISMVLTNNQLLNITLDKLMISDFFSNEKGLGKIYLKNPGQNLSSFLRLELKECHQDIKLRLIEDHYTFHLKLPRGHHHISRIKIYSESPAGLFHAWTSWKSPCSFYVYPTPKSITLTPTISAKETQVLSEEADFAHHELYQRGMNAKKINWKKFAQTDQLYWKKHEQVSRDFYHFDIQNMPGDIEEKLQYLSYLIQVAHSQGAKWDLKVYSNKLKGSGNVFYKQCMQLISGVEGN